MCMNRKVKTCETMAVNFHFLSFKMTHGGSAIVESYNRERQPSMVIVPTLHRWNGTQASLLFLPVPRNTCMHYRGLLGHLRTYEITQVTLGINQINGCAERKHVNEAKQQNCFDNVGRCYNAVQYNGVFHAAQPWPRDYLNSLRLRQNGRLFADDIFKGIFSNENVAIPIKTSLRFVPHGPINNTQHWIR